MNLANEKPKHVSSRDRYQLGCLLADPQFRTWGDSSTRLMLELALEEAVPTKAHPSRSVQMNSRVRVVDLDSDETRSITLAYPDDVDLFPDGVSVLEPLGCALLGRAQGDVVECREGQERSRFRVAAFLNGAAALEIASNPGSSERETRSAPPFTPQNAPCPRPRNAPAPERPNRRLRRALT